MSASVSNFPAAVAPAAPDFGPIDTHFHVFDAGQAQPGARYVPGYAASMGQWQTAAGGCGVRRGVLVQTSFMGTDNRRLLQELARQPQALRGVAVLAPDAPHEELVRLDTAGARGLRLNLAGTAHDMTPWRTTRLWDSLLELRWHLELHTDVGALPAVLEALPAEVPVVLDHMAKPDRVALDDPTVLAVRQRHGAQPVHIKLSGAYRLKTGQDAGALARLWRDTLGPQALLWGSDWPCTNHEAHANYPALLQDLHDLLADASTVRCALVDNPVRLYGFEP